ncbi:DUF4249 domain-containing protein [Seonamhaeicola sp. MEBiC1930]|uniref:DUF4249 domain-containing protein n=1 Tax=Seonamhaeicola sp. MEBiC01930 TaxID=2976768 RepID=UPI003246437C
MGFIKKYSFLLWVILFISCVEPVEPEFDLITGIITVEGVISNEEGSSFVKIQESELGLVFGLYKNMAINGANISFVNTNTSEVVRLTENFSPSINLSQEENEAGIYLPPKGFVASVGDTWELDIKLPDGRHYKSFPETIKEPVAIEEIDAEFIQELEYSTEWEQFFSGHTINVSFNDPADEKNYYYWNFKSFEPKVICLICRNSYFREGYCNDFDGYFPRPNGPDPFFISYLCETDCWRIRYNQKIEILDDEFINGSRVSQIPVASVLLHSKKDILIKLRQFSLSKPAYDYYNVLKDIIDNNSGFNAPPPAALVGNMFNVKNNDEYVLGRFTAAATSKATIFLKREALQGFIVEFPMESDPENESQGDPPGLPPVYYYPCEETFYSTAIKPEGWPD